MRFQYRRGFSAGRRSRVILGLFVILGIFIFLFELVDKNTAPVIINMAESRVRAMAVKAMNDSVRAIMTDPTRYTDLIHVVQDKDVKVMMVQADTFKLNDISTTAALTTQESLALIGEKGIGIPLGSVLGGQLLAGRGPSIYARIIPVGSVTTDFESEFQNEGINQTRHKIYLNLHTVVRIVIPTQSREIDVATKVLMTEVIIPGQVPNSYVNVTDPSQLDIAQSIGEK